MTAQPNSGKPHAKRSSVGHLKIEYEIYFNIVYLDSIQSSLNSLIVNIN